MIVWFSPNIITGIANGIFTFRDEDEGESGALSTEFTEARIGKITTDVVNVSNDLFGAGFEINREFAGFQVETGNAVNGYLYSPKQTSTEEESRTPLLNLVKSSTSEPITLNGFTVTEQQSGLVSEQLWSIRNHFKSYALSHCY